MKIVVTELHSYIIALLMGENGVVIARRDRSIGKVESLSENLSRADKRKGEKEKEG